MTATARLVRSPIDLSDRRGAEKPSVGIFWGVMLDDVPMMLHDGTPVADAEDYDLCKTHSRDHYSMWNVSRASLSLRGEYDDYPRGRIVFDRKRQKFVVYLDRCLDVPAFRRAIIHYFALPDASATFRYDAHYSRARHRMKFDRD